MTEAKEGTETTKATITSARTLQDIITDGKRAKGIHTGTATSIAGRIITGIGITDGTVIAIEDTIIGTTTGTAITKGVITASTLWRSTSIITIPNAIVTMTTVPTSLSWYSIRSSE